MEPTTVLEATVPLLAAQLAVTAGWGPAEVPVVDVAGVAEVDLAALEAADASAARRLGSYWDRCRTFWADPAGAWVAVRRPLVAAAQVDSKAAGRHDLRVELDALDTIAGFGPVLNELLGGSCDPDRLVALTAAYAGVVTVDGSTVTLTVRLADGTGSWPAGLGGPASAGEVTRVVTLVARQAAWRDRRVRRLTAVTVTAEEVWPDPTS